MQRKTELLLDSLAAEYANSKGGKGTRNGERKINHRTFIEAVAGGKSLGEAALVAGSKAKGDSLKTIGSNILAEHPEYRIAIQDLIQEKQHQILSSMGQDKIDNASLAGQATAFGILVDKGELLAGRPTQRTQTDVNMEALERQQLMAFIMGKFAAGQENKKLKK